MPCERLFSASAEIATDWRSHLGVDKFEHLQILKHAWQGSIVDTTKINSSEVECVELNEFQELLKRDQELSGLQGGQYVTL